MLDRLITVKLAAAGGRVDGKYVDGPVTPYRVWAEKTSSSSSDEGSEGIGTVIKALVTWRVRWLEAFAQHRIDLMSIEDEQGHAWNVEAVNESEQRRRFIDLQAIRGDQIAV